MKKMRNTKAFGFAQIFIYREKDKYIGVCLELDIVDEADSYEELRTRIVRSVTSYVDYIIKKGLDESLLNRPAPEEYWSMFYDYLANIQKSQRKIPFVNSALRSNKNEGVKPIYEAGIESVCLAAG